ncbi:uncharacterized protein LOC135497084 [Lineus longissimus]|uniref:uncharacterized protein LOC135497084 n=1 Tax=Lineus longissimus TaxID=88925 RepID=UPI00315CA862
MGWTCIGPLTKETTKCQSNHVHLYHGTTDHAKGLQIDLEMERLWNADVDTPKDQYFYTPEERIALSKAKRTIRYVDGRYEIGIPWKEDRPNLPNNRSVAERRFFNLERSLCKTPDIAKRYDEVMEANIEKGYLVPATRPPPAEPCWYLPHFPVIREQKATTKVRIVLDSAAKFKDVSLNDAMLPGPKLQRDLTDILLTFRVGPVALVGDIKEMFPQVRLLPEDQTYHRVLWRKLGSDNPLLEYKAARLTFGDRASPFLAQYVLKTHAERMIDVYPAAARACIEDTYMDDEMTNTQNVEEGIGVRKDSTAMLHDGGFQIRQWCSNKIEVLEGVPEEDRVAGIDFETEELPCIKTLGVNWDAKNDTLGYTHTPVEEVPITKRTLLSKVAKLFDPLQLLAPFVIRAKMLQQEAWMLDLGWDDPFPPSLADKVQSWIDELLEVTEFKVPRWYYQPDSTGWALHVFVDASSKAYAAVIFARSTYSDSGVLVRLVIAKAKVAPVKAVSIPRLELMAALLGMKLGLRVAKALHCEKSEIVFWTDSMDTLYWLRGQSRRYKPFVAHRVASIHLETTICQWRHVPGEVNPADLATRGRTIKELTAPNCWTDGPQFLYGGRETWPVGRMEESNSQEALKETRKSAADVASTQVKDEPAAREPVFGMYRHSSWTKTMRITAWLLRWRRTLEKLDEPTPSTLLPDEIKKAEVYWVRVMQTAPPLESAARQLRTGQPVRGMSALSPFLDDQGLLRVGGRLGRSNLPYDAKHPLILPSQHPLTETLIQHYHMRCYHTKGVNAQLAEIRERF